MDNELAVGCKPTKFKYDRITLQESSKLTNEWRHCVHVMIHAPITTPIYLFGRPQNEIKHVIMMQMRFDGRLGFPGGFVDDTDGSLEAALMREVSEEMGILPNDFQMLPTDHMCAYLLQEKKYCLHFYTKEVSYSNYLHIEARDETQLYGGFEVLGCIRVPLYIFNRKDGFPAFLRNNFIGCARDQLLKAIQTLGLLSEQTLQECIEKSRQRDPLST